MAHHYEELPLFPLRTVLFPYANMRLHVFEERYREMIRLCIHEDRPFGVVLIRTGGEVGGYADPYLVGTVARIEDVYTYDDGRMDIQVQGERRFRVRELDDSLEYLVGKIEPLIENGFEPSDHAEQLLAEAKDRFEALIQRYFAQQEFNVQVVFPDDPMAMSFTIANLLEIDELAKQRLLECTETLDRIQDLLPILQEKLTEAKMIQLSAQPYEEDIVLVQDEDFTDWTSLN